MIDIPGIYVGRFKDDPNQSTMFMQIGDTPAYTDDNWANVESTGTIWRYSSEAGEWIDTGLEEILVEEISGTKEIVAEGTVPWKLQGLKVYGKSTQATTTGAQLFDVKAYVEAGENSIFYEIGPNGGIIQINEDGRSISSMPIIQSFPAGTFTASTEDNNTYVQIVINGVEVGFANDTVSFTLEEETGVAVKIFNTSGVYPSPEYFVMLNSGSTTLPWEPYTGGKPSPSPDYPQEIVTAGSDGSIDITVSDGADQSQQLVISTPTACPVFRLIPVVIIPMRTVNSGFATR